MQNVKCFDTVTEMIKVVTNNFRGERSLNEQKVTELRKCCNIIDLLAEEFEGMGCDAEISFDKEPDIFVSLTCVDLSISDANHPYYEMFKHTKAVRFSSNLKGDLTMTFVFPGVWDKIEEVR